MFKATPHRIAALDRALTRLAMPQKRVVTLDFFSPDEIQCLREQALGQSFRQAQSEIHHKGRSVFQDFEVCFPAPRVDDFDRLAGLLETVMKRLDAPKGFVLNDFAIQHYPKRSRGIGVHRDGLRYRHLVVIITLSGGSRLFTCDDRGGRNKRRIDDRPGRLVLLCAHGFAGRVQDDARPLHGVDCVTKGRLSLGLRYESVLA